MAVDIKSGNSIANTVSQNLKAINDSLDVANSGSKQVSNLAAVSASVLGNKDLVDSIGASGVQALQTDLAKLTNDMIGANAASGGNAAAYQADMTKLTQDLNNSGVQFDLSNGQGHYDAGTLKNVATSAVLSQTQATQNVATGTTGGTQGATGTTTGAAASASDKIAATQVISQLNTIMSSVDISSPASLSKGLTAMATAIAKVAANNQLSPALNAKVQGFSSFVTQAVGTYNPTNSAQSFELIDQCVQEAFSETGLAQASKYPLQQDTSSAAGNSGGV